MKYVRVYANGKWRGYVTDTPFVLMKNLDLDLHTEPVKIATIHSLDELKPCSLSGECPFKYTTCHC